MARIYTNFAKSTLASGITNVATSLTVSAGTGALFPAAGAGSTFDAVIYNTSGTREIVSCTSRTGDVLTISRAQEGTTGVAWLAGDKIGHRLTAAAIATFNGDFKADGTVPMTGDLQIGTGKAVIFEGATADAFETTLGVVDPTADNTVLLPNQSGTVVIGQTLQAQTFTAFTTGGTSTAYTLTPTPATTANTTNQRFRVAFHTTAGATPTLAVSGQAAKNLKYKDSTGVKAAVTSSQVPANWISDVEYDGTDWVVLDVPPVSGMTLMASQATNSGTAFDFTGIPATAKQISVNLYGVSTNASSNFIIQLGDAGGVETSGYNSSVFDGAVQDSSQGFILNRGASSAYTLSGTYTLVLQDAATFVWSGSGNFRTSGSVFSCAGDKATSQVTDRVRLTTAAGDTFDAGSVSVSYWV